MGASSSKGAIFRLRDEGEPFKPAHARAPRERTRDHGNSREDHFIARVLAESRSVQHMTRLGEAWDFQVRSGAAAVSHCALAFTDGRVLSSRWRTLTS